MSIFTKMFGTHSERELKRIEPIVDRIESLRPEMLALSDDELRAKTDEFKERLSKGETLDDILPEAYAVVREAGHRVFDLEHDPENGMEGGMEHFRVQLISGIILHQGPLA